LAIVVNEFALSYGPGLICRKNIQEFFKNVKPIFQSA